MIDLKTWGWNSFFESQVNVDTEPSLVPARVLEQHRTEFVLISANGESRAVVSGRLGHEAREAEKEGVAFEWPAVGDWVLAEIRSDHDGATIRQVLTRQSAYKRKAAGPQQAEQIIAANIDFALLVAALDNDFNPRRIERYLAMAWQSGSQPAIVLTKADLCLNLAPILHELHALAPKVPVHATSVVADIGLEELAVYLIPGKTSVLLGSSGVGKSTLVNHLLGSARQQVNEVGDDDSGRHTTTSRQLIQLPSGGMIVDTPGMRELGMWRDEDTPASGLNSAFEDIYAFAAECRFGDCLHHSEPGCAVQAAIKAGKLEKKRLRNFQKLQKELEFESRKSDKQAMANSKQRWKKIQVQMNEIVKRKRF